MRKPRRLLAGIEYILGRIGADTRQVAAALAQRHFGPGANQYADQMARQQQHAHATAQVAAFERDSANKHFGALRQEMADLVQARPDLDRLSRSNPGEALKQAYALAMKARPQLGIQDRLDRELSRKDKRIRRK